MEREDWRMRPLQSDLHSPVNNLQSQIIWRAVESREVISVIGLEDVSSAGEARHRHLRSAIDSIDQPPAKWTVPSGRPQHDLW